jgi:hypothetical protein
MVLSSKKVCPVPNGTNSERAYFIPLGANSAERNVATYIAIQSIAPQPLHRKIL